jgi:hypothetical protein
MPVPKTEDESTLRRAMVKAYLTPEERDAVNAEAKRQGKTVSDLIRNIMRKELGLS